MDINQVGSMLAYKRTKDNVSMNDLCEGICDRSFYNRLEQGKRGCEKIVAEALLQRVGFASDKFIYFLDSEEYKLLQIRENLIGAVDREEFAKAEELYGEYEKETAKRSVLHRQFLLLIDSVLYWRKQLYQKSQVDFELIERKLCEAWNITRGNYKLAEGCPQYMGFVELLIKCFYFRLQEEQGRIVCALNGYENILAYMNEKMDERDKATFYIQTAYRMLCLMEKIGESTDETQEQLYQNCMTFLKRHGRMTCLSELAEYRMAYLERVKKIVNFNDAKKEVSELKKIICIVHWLYEKYQVNTNDWSWYLPLGMEEVIPLSEAIRGRRLSFGWTQEELAEGICDPVTISRIETGASNCRLGKLGDLMDKLHLPGGTAVLAVRTGRFELYDKVDEVGRLSSFGLFNEIRPLLSELKEKVVHDRYTEQYLLGKEGRANYLLGIWSAEKCWETSKKALYMTVPMKEPRELEKWSFTKTEVNIINGFSYDGERIGKAKEAIEWLHVVRQYYERQILDVSHYVRGYEMTLRNLGDLLGNANEFEEAIQYEDTAICLGLQMKKTNVLGLTLYDRAWNMEQLWGKDYTKEESRPYMEAALILSRLYSKQQAVAHVEKHWEKFYS
ncbi:MAG: helix-turn-helix transcriptional regulator [Lachnospiraceae bacterium]|nr:helix-turn-helix transcriptional regulator [Lachnospiraceae bacterium]